MKITTVFIVRDPEPDSDPVDCCFSYPAGSQGFANYIRGGPRDSWSSERTTLWTDAAEAVADVEERFRRLRGGMPEGVALPVAHDGEIRWVRVPGREA